MDEIGAYKAKTRLAELLVRVEKGERIVITRHGRPVAQLVPVPGAPDRTVDEAVAAILSFRTGRTLGTGLAVRDLIQEGRR